MPLIDYEKILEMRNRRRNNHSWWYRFIRSINLFCYKYWWFVWLLFILAIILIYFFCKCNSNRNYNNESFNSNERTEIILNKARKCCTCNYEVVNPDRVTPIDSLDIIRDQFGGKTGEITITLAWETQDDLDLHLLEPNGNEIYFENKLSSTGGHLDIDMNADKILTVEPLENIYYKNTPPSGTYQVVVDFYKRNTNIQIVSYKVYVKIGDKEQTFQYDHKNEKDAHLVLKFQYPSQNP